MLKKSLAILLLLMLLAAVAPSAVFAAASESNAGTVYTAQNAGTYPTLLTDYTSFNPIINLRVAQKLLVAPLNSQNVKDYVFISSNPTFVSVDSDGVLTGRKAGVTVISFFALSVPNEKIIMVINCS